MSVRDFGSCELSFPKQPELVSIVRRFIANFYGKTLSHAEAQSRLALAAHELLENAVKYTRDGQAHVRIEVEELKGEGKDCIRIRIRTRNRAFPRDAEVLRQAIVEIQASGEPQAYYLAVLRRNAKRAQGSGLGLARIYAEADMKMSVSYARGGTVTISAETEIDLAAQKKAS